MTASCSTRRCIAVSCRRISVSKIAQPDILPNVTKLVINADAIANYYRRTFHLGGRESFIIATLRVCQNCRVRNKDTTIEAILFEYSRRPIRASIAYECRM